MCPLFLNLYRLLRFSIFAKNSSGGMNMAGKNEAEDAIFADKKTVEKAIEILYYTLSIFFVVYLIRYLFLGIGGPALLAVTLIPIAYIIVVLADMRKDEYYPGLPEAVRYGMILVITILGLASSIYMSLNYDAIRMLRLGRWNTMDYIFATIPVIFTLEYAYRKYKPIFIIVAALLLYAAYGYMVPGMFRHSGLSWTRILQAMSLEMDTGVYADLPQLGLTLIVSFIMILGFLRGFGCIRSIMKWASKIAKISVHALPQSAVVGSFAVAMVSGSGPANAATTGAVTIPALKKAGFPALHAASIETASSLGGQLMPPVMGITAFIMVEFLNVSYFDVIIRGFGPAIVYFVSVSLAVFLLTIQYQEEREYSQDEASLLEEAKITIIDRANFLAFVAVITSLILLMGVVRMTAMAAAVRVLVGLVIFLTAVFLLDNFRDLRGWQGVKQFLAPYFRSVDTLASLGADLAVLLSVLGMLAGALEITGVPTRIGALMVQAASIHVVLVVGVAFLFGYVLGMGLPPAPVYIMVALAVAPTMTDLGLHTWSVHFFAFFIGVFGHLSPPTSLTAAVTSKVAGSNYTRTIIKSLEYCLPLLVLMAAVFTRPNMVVELGAAQVWSAAIVAIGTVGLTFALHGKYHNNKIKDRMIRSVLAVISGLVLFYPNLTVAYFMLIPAIAFIVYGFYLAASGRLQVIAETRRAS